MLGCTPADDAVISSNVVTPDLDGSYVLDESSSFRRFREHLANETDPERRRAWESILARFIAMNSNLRIAHGVIRSGSPTVKEYPLVQEFSLKDARREDNLLHATATHHEDIDDPGDMQDVELTIRKDGDRLLLIVHTDTTRADTLYFVRKGPGAT